MIYEQRYFRIHIGSLSFFQLEIATDYIRDTPFISWKRKQTDGAENIVNEKRLI